LFLHQVEEERFAVTERIYLYRNFEIAITAKPLSASSHAVALFRTCYICHVRLSSVDGRQHLPSLALLDSGAHLFDNEQDAVIAGRCAGEAAINAALARVEHKAERAAEITCVR
jgi:hypothetical protein